MPVTKTKVPDPAPTCQKLQQAEHRYPEQRVTRRSLISVFVHAQAVFRLQATRPDVRSIEIVWTANRRG
jgi:hypothetical protein